MTEPVKPTKTPAQIETEKLQKEWESAVRVALELIASEIPKLDPNDTDTRAAIYRDLVALKEKIAQCGPALRKMFNHAIDVLYAEMDAVPNSMYLPEEDPKP